MASHKPNPAARLGAGRAGDRFTCRAALNNPQIAQPLAHFQAAHLARRFRLAPALAAIVAPLVFGEARP
jgi:hypothetical protein